MVFMDLGEGLKKVFLAGVGAVATTAETAKEVIDDLVSKGELTMEQGKVLNEELKRNAKQKVKQHVTVNVTKEFKDAFSAVEHMNAEELEALKEEIRKAEEKAAQILCRVRPRELFSVRLHAVQGLSLPQSQAQRQNKGKRVTDRLCPENSVYPQKNRENIDKRNQKNDLPEGSNKNRWRRFSKGLEKRRGKHNESENRSDDKVYSQSGNTDRHHFLSSSEQEDQLSRK